MSDYCIYCGDTKNTGNNGRYVALTDDEDLGLFTEAFLCSECEAMKHSE